MEGGNFDRELLERLPLAEGCLRVFLHALDNEMLEQLFEENRGRCYTKQIKFCTMVQMLRNALLQHGGSGHKAFNEAQEQGELKAAISSTYEKLNHIPLRVSEALLLEASMRLQKLLPLMRTDLPASLREFEVLVGDSKTLKQVPHLLKPTRQLAGKLLGGKFLAALRLRSGTVLAISCSADSFVNELQLVDRLLEQVDRIREGELLCRAILWVMDRQYGDLSLMHDIQRRKEHFLIRCTKAITFQPDPSRPGTEGGDPQGRKFRQQWGWLGAERRGDRAYVRRIVLALGKGQELSLVTDLLDDHAHPAEDLLEVYDRRWGIETAFQELTEVFSLQQMVGTHPNAVLFQASFCMVLFNILALIKAYVARAGHKKPSEVSTRKLFDDVRDELVAWGVAADIPRTVDALLPVLPAERLREKLGKQLRSEWRDWWKKTPTRKSKNPPPKIRTPSGRACVWRVLQQNQKHRAST